MTRSTGIGFGESAKCYLLKDISCLQEVLRNWVNLAEMIEYSLDVAVIFWAYIPVIYRGLKEEEKREGSAICQDRIYTSREGVWELAKTTMNRSFDSERASKIL